MCRNRTTANGGIFCVVTRGHGRCCSQSMCRYNQLYGGGRNFCSQTVDVYTETERYMQETSGFSKYLQTQMLTTTTTQNNKGPRSELSSCRIKHQARTVLAQRAGRRETRLRTGYAARACHFFHQPLDTLRRIVQFTAGSLLTSAEGQRTSEMGASRGTAARTAGGHAPRKEA